MTNPPSPHRRVTVRLGGAAHQLIAARAAAEGVPLAQYLREAALMRAAFDLVVLQGGQTDDLQEYRRELLRLRRALDLAAPPLPPG